MNETEDKYDVVYGSTILKLREIVNEYIAKGWLPQGGVCGEQDTASIKL